MKNIHSENTLPGLSEAITRSGLSVPKIAELTGLSQPHIYKLKYGAVGASGGAVSKLAEALGCSRDDLYVSSG